MTTLLIGAGGRVVPVCSPACSTAFRGAVLSYASYLTSWNLSFLRSKVGSDTLYLKVKGQ